MVKSIGSIFPAKRSRVTVASVTDKFFGGQFFPHSIAILRTLLPETRFLGQGIFGETGFLNSLFIALLWEKHQVAQLS
jgi:hypothetical protein